jgi:hypothetical protein
MSEILSKMYVGLKVTVMLVRFYETWTFWTDFQKILKYQFVFENPSTEIRGVVCGQTDLMNLIVAFRNFAVAP